MRPTSVSPRLGRRERLKRWLGLRGWHHEYRYPDGTVELAFENAAGIDPFVDDEETKHRKMREYFARVRQRNKAFGAMLVAAGIVFLALHLNLDLGTAVIAGALIGFGVWRAAGGESRGDYA